MTRTKAGCRVQHGEGPFRAALQAMLTASFQAHSGSIDKLKHSAYKPTQTLGPHI